MYAHYKETQDPLLYESEAYESGDPYNAVECPNGCGFWRGDLLTDGCPDCGSDCHEIDQD